MVEKSESVDKSTNIDRRKYLQTAGALAAGLAIGGAAGWFTRPAEVVTEKVTETLTATVTGGAAAAVTSVNDWVKKVSAPYKGTTVKIVTEGTPPSAWVKEVLVPEFQTVSGINVEIELASWDDAYKKSILDAEQKAGTLDAYYIDELENAALFMQKGYVQDLYALWKEHPELYYPDLDPADLIPVKFFTIDGKLGGLPFECYMRPYAYRKDLFEDPKEQANFKAKYGLDLKPAKTWEEYERIAEFFCRPEQDMYGHTCMPAWMPGDQHDFLMTYGVTGHGISVGRKASVAQGGRVDDPASLDWLKRYLKLLKYAPPGIQAFSWEDMSAQFLAGRIAQGILYADSLAQITNPKVSRVAGKVGVSLCPIEPKHCQWYVPTIYGDMGSWQISSSSGNAEATLIFLQWLTSKEIAAREMEELGTMCSRTSLASSALADKIDAKFGWSFFKVYREALTGGALSGPKIPMVELLSAYDPMVSWFSKVLTGEVSPEDCLRELAKDIDAKMKELGW